MAATANTIATRDSNASITANIFIGNIAGANVTGTVANANYSTYAGTVLTNAQPNITSVGTLSSLTVTGTITGGNIYANSGTIKAATLVGEAGNLSNITGANVTGAVTYATTANNVAGANVTGAVASASALLSNTSSATTAYPTFVTSSSNGYAQNFINSSLSANLANGAYIATTFAGNATTAGTVTTAAQPNITSVGTLSSLTVSGKVTAGQLQGDGGNISNIQGANVSGAVTYATTANNVAGANVSGQVANALVAGTVYTAAQPNITSVGSLTSLTTTGDAIIGGNLKITGNLTYINVQTLSTSDPIINLQTGANGGPLASNSGYDVGSAMNYYTSSQVTGFMGWKSANAEFVVASNVTITNQVTTINTLGNLRVGNIIGNGQALTGLTGGNVTGQVGNALVAGTVYTAAQPNITSVGTITGGIWNNNIGSSATFAAGLSGANLASITGGNVTGQVGNSLVAGTVYTAAQPNITSVGTLTSLGVSGTITAANVTANTGVFTGNGNGLSSLQGANLTGTINSTVLGNSTVYIGTTGIALNRASASQSLTGITSIDGYASTVSTAAQPNITSVGTLTSLGSSGNITAPNLIANTGFLFTSVATGISAAGTVQANATALTKGFNVVSTVSVGQGVALPTAVAGMTVNVVNTSANSLLVYPASGGTIGFLSLNAAATQTANSTIQYIATSSTQWYQINATYA